MFSIIPLAVLGLGVGWVINYLADVLPLGRRVTRPRCVHCEGQQPLLWYPLWPQRCAHCGARQAYFPRHLLVLITAVAATVWLGHTPPPRLGFGWGLLLLVFMAVVVVIDIEHRLVLHQVSLVGVALGLGLGIRLHGLQYTLLGGAVGFLLMFLLYKLGEVFVRMMSRVRGEVVDEVALGFGDVNLNGVLGLMLGYPVVLIGLVLGVLVGGVFSFVYLVLGLLLRRYRSFEALPYAPFLVVAAALLLYFPDATRTFLLSLSPLMAAAVTK